MLTLSKGPHSAAAPVNLFVRGMQYAMFTYKSKPERKTVLGNALILSCLRSVVLASFSLVPMFLLPQVACGFWILLFGTLPSSQSGLLNFDFPSGSQHQFCSSVLAQILFILSSENLSFSFHLAEPYYLNIPVPSWAFSESNTMNQLWNSGSVSGTLLNICTRYSYLTNRK